MQQNSSVLHLMPVHDVIVTYLGVKCAFLANLVVGHA
jgi:hypothetical protein